MPKNSLTAIIVAVAIGLTVLFSLFFMKSTDFIAASARLRGTPSAVADPSSPAPARARATEQALPPIQGLRTNAEVIQKDLQQDVRSLEETLAERRRVLAEKNEALNEIRAEMNAGATPQATPAYATEIAGRSEEIQTLNANLEEARAAREAIRIQETDALQARRNAAELSMAQLDAEITRLETEHAQLEKQWQEWSRRNFNVNGLPGKNPEMETALAEKQQQIQVARDNRLALETDHRMQADSIFTLSQQARDDLRQQEQTLRTEIFSLQSEIRRIQRLQSEQRMSQQSSTSRLQQIQRDVQQEAEQVNTLEKSLQQKRNELQRIQ